MAIGKALITVAAAAVLWTPIAVGQSTPADYRDEFLEHFERSSRKIVSLAEAMPAELYSWSPGDGVMHVSQVYMHIARYNFYYLSSSLDIDAPHGIEMEDLESITDKQQVITLLRQSVDHVQRWTERMTPENLESGTRLYGRKVAGWAVLFQLLAHMNEHVGQSVAYARMNGIAPPWSM